MVRLKMPPALNLGNALVIAGVLVLGASFWLPHATAARMHRVEAQAESHARRLCEIARALPDLDLGSPDTQQLVLDRLAGDRLDPVPVPGELTGKAVFFKSKHYYFMLTRTPPAGDAADTPMTVVPHLQPARESEWRWPWRFADSSKLLPFEVYAWPAALIGPGVAVFFHPSDGLPAFCRNLDHTYHGLQQHPLPGNARKQFEGRNRPGMLKWYRGFDDARWLLPRSDGDV